MGEIRTEPRPACLLCGSRGAVLYRDLPDALFGVPGRWTLTRCVNPDCGLAWLDPMPIEADLPMAYETYYTHPEDGGRAASGSRLFARLRAGYLAAHYGYANGRSPGWLGEAIRLHPGWRAEADFSIYRQPALAAAGRLLDIGCGDGAALQRLRDLGWQQLEGVDLDGRAVEAARRRGLSVRQGTLSEQGYQAATFDVITMSHVIEHVPDPVAFLRECHRILRPGGRLVLYTPNLDSWSRSLFGSSWPGLDPPRHLHLFTRRTLTIALEKSGSWQVDSLTTTVRGAGVHMLASRDTRRVGRAEIGRRGTIPERVAAHLFTFAYAGRVQLNKWTGEELTLLARRD